MPAALLVVAGLLAAPAAAHGAVEDTPVCDTAAELTEEGYPQRAVALIATAQGGADVSPCPTERDAALVAIAEAERLVDADDLAGAGVKDRENADVVEASGPSPESRATFERSLADGLKPVGSLLLVLAGMVLTLVVVARLLTSLPVPWFRTRPWLSGWLTVLGTAAVGVGSWRALLQLRGSGVIDPASVWWLALAVLGTLVLTVAQATRLRVAVVATDEIAGHVVALLGELGARPPEGLEVPRGADVDTLGGGALDSLPEQRVAKALAMVVKNLLGLTPWRVMVDTLDDGRIAVAMTRNGRGSATALVEPAVLGLPATTDDEKAAAGKADLYRFVAAFVMVTLARHHRGFDGLCGARDWRSLGLHYVATTDFVKDEDRKTALLVRAVKEDPGNWLAQVALASARWRTSNKAEELELYLRWLDAATPVARRTPLTKLLPEQAFDPSPDPDTSALTSADAEPLLIRLLLTRAKVAINYECARRAAAGESVLVPATGSPVQAAVGDLLRYLTRQPGAGAVDLVRAALTRVLPGLRHRGQDAGVFLARIHAEAAVLDSLVRNHPGRDQAASLGWDLPATWATVAGWPTLRYSEGCTAATHAEARALADVRERAMALLTDAAVSPELRDWMSKDPQLAAVRAGWGSAAEGVRPQPEQDLFALDLYAVHTARFTELGIAYPADVAASRCHELAAELKIARVAAQRLIDVAVVHESANGDGLLESYRVELLRTILTKGPEVTATETVQDVTERMWLVPAELTDGRRNPPTRLVEAVRPWIAVVFPSVGAPAGRGSRLSRRRRALPTRAR